MGYSYLAPSEHSDTLISGNGLTASGLLSDYIDRDAYQGTGIDRKTCIDVCCNQIGSTAWFWGMGQKGACPSLTVSKPPKPPIHWWDKFCC